MGIDKVITPPLGFEGGKTIDLGDGMCSHPARGGVAYGILYSAVHSEMSPVTVSAGCGQKKRLI